MLNKPYLIKSGISVVEGGYLSGKTTLVPEIIRDYYRDTQLKLNKIKEQKAKMNNLKTYTIEDILNDGSSSEEEEEE